MNDVKMREMKRMPLSFLWHTVVTLFPRASHYTPCTQGTKWDNLVFWFPPAGPNTAHRSSLHTSDRRFRAHISCSPGTHFYTFRCCTISKGTAPNMEEIKSILSSYKPWWMFAIDWFALDWFLVDNHSFWGKMVSQHCFNLLLSNYQWCWTFLFIYLFAISTSLPENCLFQIQIFWTGSFNLGGIWFLKNLLIYCCS